MNEIQKQILEKLNQIQESHHVRIPFAIESGSRAWGFESPDSDYDCRFIYVQPTAKYLSIFEQKDTIDYAPDQVFDLNGWDLKKFIQHLVKSNAVMLEWLSSQVVYRKNEDFVKELWDLGQAFYNPVTVSWHYLSMAEKKLEEVYESRTAKIKKYFYIMRPLACIQYIRKYGNIPFMEYQRNLEAIEVPIHILEEIDLLLSKKERVLEGEEISRNDVLLDYFTEEFRSAGEWLSTVKFEKNKDYVSADRAFLKILKMVNSNE